MAASRLDSRGEDEASGRRELVAEELACMKALLRLTQLLCENHNSNLQNLLRHQPHNRISYNLVLQTTKYLDTYGLALHINDQNVGNVVQVRMGTTVKAALQVRAGACLLAFPCVN